VPLVLILIALIVMFLEFALNVDLADLMLLIIVLILVRKIVLTVMKKEFVEYVKKVGNYIQVIIYVENVRQIVKFVIRIFRIVVEHVVTVFI
jgi:uncharacterized membrane protein